MSNSKNLIDALRTRKLRATQIRLAIIKAINGTTTPLSSQQLLSRLGKKPHKTTIYREVETLARAGLIRSIDAGDGIKRYESTSRKHHHHAICMSCRSIKEIPATNCLQEVRGARRSGFLVQDHDVQVFGLCANCK